MNVAISNIAWGPDDDLAVASLMQRSGALGVEVAPTKVWPAPLEVDAASAAGYREWWASQGISVVAMQSLLFGKPDLKLFGDPQVREQMLDYLSGIVALGGLLGARVLVFGAPRNRLVTGSGEPDPWAVAIDFFRRLGDTAVAHGTTVCIEPNPTDYGCDFIVNTKEGVQLVRDVNSPGFGLHLDAAVMTLNGEDPAAALSQATGTLRHFHASELHLGNLHAGGAVDHTAMAEALKGVGYQGWVSIEMRDGGGLDAVADALTYVVSVYG